MADTKTYTGGCHCGAVRYAVTTRLDQGVTCNCSICSKSGTVLAFAPASQFQLTSGAEALTDYQWGRKRIHHLFCSRCGVRSFSRATMPDGTEGVAVNVRCLDGVDVDALPKKQVDGRSFPAE